MLSATEPRIGVSRSPGGASSRGIELQQPVRVRVPGRANSSCRSARSTTRPPYSTFTWSHRPATTPRSCVIMISAVPVLDDQLLEQRQDLRLDGDVQRGGRLVGDQQPGPAGQRHRDQRPLPHAAGELVRVLLEPPVRVRDADRVEQVPRPRAWPRDRFIPRCRSSTSVTWIPIGHHRVQRGQRVLEDHRQVPAAPVPHRRPGGSVEQVGALEDAPSPVTAVARAWAAAP